MCSPSSSADADTSSKGRGKGEEMMLAAHFLAPPLGELAREHLRGRSCEKKYNKKAGVVFHASLFEC